MIIKAHKTHKIGIGENLNEILDIYLPRLQEKNIVVITSKIISLCQKRVISMKDEPNRQNLVPHEADYYLDEKYSTYGFTLSIKNNILIPAAGIDGSNGNGYWILWPKDLQNTVNSIWEFLRKKYSIKDLGVMVTDSKSTPLRWGTTGIGMAFCGFTPLKNYINTKDIYGHLLHVTKSNLLDGLAASAVMIMGEGNEQTPLAVISQIPFVTFTQAPPNQDEIEALHIALKDDIYAPIFEYKKFKKGVD